MAKGEGNEDKETEKEKERREGNEKIKLYLIHNHSRRVVYLLFGQRSPRQNVGLAGAEATAAAELSKSLGITTAPPLLKQRE